MPPLNARLHTPSPDLRRATELPPWDPIVSPSGLEHVTGTARSAPPGAEVVNLERLKKLAQLHERPAHARQMPGRVEVSAVFTNAWKREIYDAWVDLDLLPAFMRGLDQDAGAERFELPWHLRLGDREVRWEARTTECLPGERICWEGGEHAACHNWGCVTFEPEGRAITRVRVSLNFGTSADPEATGLTWRRIELQLRDTMALLQTFLAPHALPPAPASL